MERHINQFRVLVTVMICAVVVASCNSDIFIDDDRNTPDDLKSETIYVDGDQGLAEVPIHFKGLQHIYVDPYGSEQSKYKYFNHKSEEVDAYAPASEISSIWYFDPLCEFTIAMLGDRITVSTYQNCSQKELMVPVQLHYSYGVKNITIFIKKGAPLEFLFSNYKGDFEITDNVKTQQSTWTVHNNGNKPATVQVKPYQNVSCVGLIRPDASWALDRSLKIAIPYYFDFGPEDTGWMLTEIGDINLGDTFQYNRFDNDKSVPVEVPANSHVDINVTVSFSQAVARGELLFRAPVSDTQLTVNYDCTVMQPVSYQIDVVKK